MNRRERRAIAKNSGTSPKSPAATTPAALYQAGLQHLGAGRHLDAQICCQHLAATLGRSTWVMLPYVPDWRWRLDRDDSPWYPTVRLFRQPEARDYDSVVKRVRTELMAAISTFERAKTPARQATQREIRIR